MRFPDRRSGAIRPADGRALLVHLASGVGNLVFATPLLVALERLGYTVDLLLHADYPQAADLFRGWSAVRAVHAGRFPASERYHRLVPAVPPFYWSGLRRMYAGRRDALARPPDALFWRDEQGWYLAFAAALGWPAHQRPVPTLPVAADEAHGVGPSTLVLAPGCKTGEMAAKRWPGFPTLAERFADVAVVGTDDDLRTFGGAPLRFPAHVRSLVGRLTLRETAEVLAAAGAVVANDSGLGHVAGAVGAPTLLLFGPTSEQVLGPLPPNVAVLRAGLACEPCWTTARLRACDGRVTCLASLPVDRVEAEARALLGPATAASGDGLRALPVISADTHGDGGMEMEMGSETGMGMGIDTKTGMGIGISAPAAAPRTVASIRIVPRAAPGAEIAPSPSPDCVDGDESIPLISCLMPTRDRHRFVPRAVEHFLRQDHPRRELVVVDDGARPVDDLLPPDPRIRYHRVDRARTLGGKRNLACSLARGEILAHWDDDDWMPRHRLSAQLRALEAATGADVCGLATVRFFDPAAGRAWDYRWSERGRPWVAGGTLVYRRRAWERRPFPEIDEGEDTRWLWSQPPGTIATIADPGLYAALVHPGNTSRKRTGESRWHPVALELVQQAMGDDWAFYAELAPAARRRAG